MSTSTLPSAVELPSACVATVLDSARARPARTKDRFLVFGSPALGDEEVDEVVATLKSGWLGSGPRVTQFEQAMAAYKGSPHAVALNSCTAALHLSLLSAGVGPGDEVITTALTFCATVNAIIHAGATPVLADVDPETMNIDPSSVESAITPRTKALLPVHFAGRPCEMDALMDICERHRLVLIEDCAHAIETSYHGRPVGTFGAFGCLSFYVTKNMVTGEGGMVLTQHPEAADRIKMLALHGMSQDAWKRFSDDGYKHYDVVAAGFKYNMMDLQAAIGLRQLDKLEPFWLRRQQIWQRYDAAFAGLPVTRPSPPAAHTRHGLHLYNLLIDEARTGGINRDRFLTHMNDEHIGVGVHYRAIAEHSYYRERYGWTSESVPHAARIGRQTVSIPLSAKLSDADVDDVISAVCRSVTGGAR